MKLLDLFCGAGGAAMVVGVDNRPQPHYPFEFHQADAPPCQAYSSLRHIAGNGNSHPDLVGPTRERLRGSTALWVIENVPGSPLRSPIVLCGTAFERFSGEWELWRHRWFEANFPWGTAPPSCRHRERPLVAGVYGGGGFRAPGHHKHGKGSSASLRREVMGIDWMNRDEMAQAIPPAYTKWVGDQIWGALACA